MISRVFPGSINPNLTGGLDIRSLERLKENEKKEDWLSGDIHIRIYKIYYVHSAIEKSKKIRKNKKQTRKKRKRSTVRKQNKF